MSSQGVAVDAPGKINLVLRVLDRRPDGYHNLWSIMQAIDLADTVVAEQDEEAPGIRFFCEGADLPTDARNLAYRAAEQVLAQVGRPGGIRLVVRKRLPVAAGVGGGSSDAAATIRALTTLFNTGWSRADMAALGLAIGSDVPFFFFGPTALVEGRGERVSPLHVEGGGWLVLVNPGIAISTAWAYARLAASRTEEEPRQPFRPPLLFSTREPNRPPAVKWSELVAVAANDFGPVMEREYTVLGDIRRLLLDRGAQAAVLSGSGATVFGVFPSESVARAAAEGLDRRSGWRVWVTQTRSVPCS